MELVGKSVNIPGSFGGSSAVTSEAKRIYKCTVIDFRLKHVFEEGEDNEHTSDAVHLTEMGVDGAGGNSEDFWVKYPYPFLKLYYDTYPAELPGYCLEWRVLVVL